MQRILLVIVTTIIASCATGPRPYDGVIGYQVTDHQDGVHVAYVEESKTGRDKILAKISAVCASKKGIGGSQGALRIVSEREFVREVGFSVPVATGNAFSGESSAGSGPAAPVTDPVSLNQQIVRELNLRKIEAICPNNSP